MKSNNMENNFVFLVSTAVIKVIIISHRMKDIFSLNTQAAKLKKQVKPPTGLCLATPIFMADERAGIAVKPGFTKLETEQLENGNAYKSRSSFRKEMGKLH